MVYKVALNAKANYVGNLHNTIKVAREAQKKAGSEYHIYRFHRYLVKNKSGWKMVEEWKKWE